MILSINKKRAYTSLFIVFISSIVTHTIKPHGQHAAQPSTPHQEQLPTKKNSHNDHDGHNHQTNPHTDSAHTADNTNPDSTTIDDHSESDHDDHEDGASDRTIRHIYIVGNQIISDQAVLNRLPFREGELFDPLKTHQLIHNLYFDLKRFRNIIVKGKLIGDSQIDLYIIVEEKTPLKEVLFKGNKNLSDKEIKKKIDFSAIPAFDPEELKKYTLDLKKMYEEKNYHHTDITTSVEYDELKRATVTFTVQENQKSLVKRVLFKGNNSISDKNLKNKMFTREDWILGFMEKAGTFQPDHMEADKHIIETIYQSNGFLNAKVIEIEPITDPVTKHLTVVYHIQEGDLYVISDVHAPGNDLVSEEYLLAVIGMVPGQLYSREHVVDAIKALEVIWGQFGYIYANIEPAIEPNDETKTVSVTFHSDLGNKVTLNRINIKGNKKTRDKIIRRRLVLNEGELLTTKKMDDSKDNVEALGYFEPRDGVNWKIIRVDEGLANLELLVKEAKTGRAHLKVGYGGSPTNMQSAAGGFSAGIEVTDTNLFGKGINFNLNTNLAKDEQSIIFNLTEPWLFDKPISAGTDFYHRRVAYDELTHAKVVHEKTTGGSLNLGFLTGLRHQFFQDVFVRFSVGADSLRYDKDQPQASIYGQPAFVSQQYQCILDRLFKPDTYMTFSTTLGQDRKNHPMHPSRGHKWLACSRFAFPGFKGNIGFHKFDFDFSWFTPLIGERDLVLHLHGYFGIVTPFNNRTIPYRELFHIGGPATVRGFLFGQIGPQFRVNGRSDSIGGSKAVFWKAELIFPIKPDFSIKGLFFYDGGTGWDNPYAHCTTKPYLQNNTFSYRHSVGVGVRMLQPAPVSIDWGFKLDPKKGETASEIHFGMTYDW